MRVNGSTIHAANKLAMDKGKLERTLRRRYGFTRRDLIPLNAGRGETYTASVQRECQIAFLVPRNARSSETYTAGGAR